MLPKFSIKDTYFLDTSKHAINELNRRGGKGVVMGAEEFLPFQKNFFDLIGAFEVLEHLENPEKTIQGIAQVLKIGGLLIFSVPMNQGYWSSWDVFAGHVQRFEQKHLTDVLEKQGFRVEHCYVSGRMAKKRFFSWVIRRASFLPLYFPNFFFFFYQYLILPYAWFGRTFSRSIHYSSLQYIPQDSTSVLVVCRKQ
jgi:SAM-dependent methyltransferase